MRTADVEKRDGEVERLLAASLKAMGHQRPLPAPLLPDHYDPAFVNADRDLSILVTGLRATSDARLCLYGPPGTGKTAFAHYLGRSLDRSVLIKRGSDLLDPFLGGTEQMIANAFREARDEKAILVIDEADGFLRDRAMAHHSWEVTQVNELLTQMEGFNGTFIASTNLVDMLDAASLRRFDFKVKFDYLRCDQKRALLRVVAGDMERDSEVQKPVLARLDGLETLTPGDFSNVLRQLRITGQPAASSNIVALLAAEAAMKPEGRHRTVGFTARWRDNDVVAG